jgi:hypothetical protein
MNRILDQESRIRDVGIKHRRVCRANIIVEAHRLIADGGIPEDGCRELIHEVRVRVRRINDNYGRCRKVGVFPCERRTGTVDVEDKEGLSIPRVELDVLAQKCLGFGDPAHRRERICAKWPIWQAADERSRWFWRNAQFVSMFGTARFHFSGPIWCGYRSGRSSSISV